MNIDYSLKIIWVIIWDEKIFNIYNLSILW
jgi:hypothetical protein